jgi:aldose 1-epimerase
LLRAFPFPHVLELDVSTGTDGLRVETTLTAGDRGPVPVSFGRHPYFLLPGSAEGWRLELPDCTSLELDVRGIPTGRSVPDRRGTVTAPRSRLGQLFALERPSSVAVAGGGLRFEVRYGAGYIEPMTAPTDALTRDECPLVDPGETFRAAFEVAVSKES